MEHGFNKNNLQLMWFGTLLIRNIAQPLYISLRAEHLSARNMSKNWEEKDQKWELDLQGRIKRTKYEWHSQMDGGKSIITSQGLLGENTKKGKESFKEVQGVQLGKMQWNFEMENVR